MLTRLMTVLSLMPVIITAVKSVEEAIPGSGNGKTKLAIILDSILAVTAEAQALIPAITSIIGIVVAGLNAAGVFKKEISN
jgi:hypothetical protein